MRSLEGSRDRKFSSSRAYEPGLALQESVHENVLSLMMNRADRAEILGYLAAEGNEYHYAQTHWRFFPTRGLSGKWYLIHYKQDAVEFTSIWPFSRGFWTCSIGCTAWTKPVSIERDVSELGRGQ